MHHCCYILVCSILFYQLDLLALFQILLKGASGDELKKVKHVVQYGIFAAYHLALETSYLADEGASLPELPLKSPITVALPDKTLDISRSISTIADLVTPTSEDSHLISHVPSFITANTVSTSERNASSCMTKLESSSDSVTSTVDGPLGSSLYDVPNSICNDQDGVSEHVSRIGVEQFPESHSISVKPNECLHDDYAIASSFRSSVPFRQSVLKRDDDGSTLSEPDPKNSSNLLDSNNGEQNEKVQQLKQGFQLPPSDGQSILVSLTTRCVWKGVVCERAHLFRIKYYRTFDKPLGRFLQDDLFDQV